MLLTNYLSIAIRSLLRHPFYSLITIFSLSLGLAAGLLLAVFFTHEYGVDRFHENLDRIYRVYLRTDLVDESYEQAPVPSKVADDLIRLFPEKISAVVRIAYGADILIRGGGKQFYENEYLYADASFFEIFSFPLLKGDPATALQKPNSMVVTERTARKYFGDKNPLGLKFQEEDGGEYTITGIAANPPDGTQIKFEFLASMITVLPMLQKEGFDLNYWTYVLLKPGVEPAKLEAEFPTIDRSILQPPIAKRLGLDDKQLAQSGLSRNLRLQAFKDVYYSPPVLSEPFQKGNRTFSFVLLLTGIAILGSATINFTNLAIVRASGRVREAGLRKVFGATRNQLVSQFLFETILICLVAAVIALAIAELTLPAFAELAGRSLAIAGLHRPGFLGAVLAACCLIGLVAGIYPALSISRAKPIPVLKGRSFIQLGGSRLSAILVFTQIALSTAVLVTGLVAVRQLKFLRTASTGFDHHNIHFFMIPQLVFPKSGEWSAAIAATPGVKGTVALNAIPGLGTYATLARSLDHDSSTIRSVRVIESCSNISPFLGLTFIAGGEGKQAITSDMSFPDSKTVPTIINETGVRIFGLTKPIGAKLTCVSGLTYVITGVVRDFNFESLELGIKPMLVFQRQWSAFSYLAVRLDPNRESVTIRTLKQLWKKFFPEHPMMFYSLEQRIEKQYAPVQNTVSILLIGSFISFLIACVGLIGQIGLITAIRSREIGIRRILGASKLNLVGLLTRPNLRLFLPAVLTGWALAYIAVLPWLNLFAFRISLTADPFFISAAIAAALISGTSLFQSIRTASLNPRDAIAYE